MDKQSNSTTVPEISTLIAGSDEAEVAHILKADDLRALTMEELHAMMDLLVTLDNVTCAFLNQPRFTAGRTYNRAGELGDEIGTHLSGCIALIEEVAKEADPRTSKEAGARAWLLLQRAANYSESFPRFLVAAAQLSVSVSEVEAA